MIHIHIYNKNEKTSKSCMYWAKGFFMSDLLLIEWRGIDDGGHSRGIGGEGPIRNL